MTKDDGGPAFPHFTRHTLRDGLVVEATVPGMSLRQWYAGQALNACLDYHGPKEPAEAAASAYAIADAMIEAATLPNTQKEGT
jgi:hypothetical protein